MAEKDGKERKTDSSMSVGGQKMRSDSECVGQIADEGEQKKESAGREKDQGASGSSMRAGRHQCVDDQCIGKG